MIPQIYFDYLREGDARPLLRVFYHNAMDVVSLAALLNHTSALLEDPFSHPTAEITDLAAVARLLEDLGHFDRAAELYQLCLSSGLPDEIHTDTLLRLALLHKHNNNYTAAVPLWEQAASRRRIYAFEELAKYFEHHALDLHLALKWTLEALEVIQTAGLPNAESLWWKSEFQHRSQRLQKKLSSKAE
jgi:tetratricopeptide (TPR) repeat protein